jgi:hypothetical protein
VDVIHQKDVIDQLSSGIYTIINKIDRIISKDITKTQGDCCNGCTVNCEFVKPPKFAESPKANIADFAEFLKNVDAVKEKVIRVLETCIYENEIPEIDSKRT